MAVLMNQDELKVLEERIKANPKSRSFLQLAEAYIEVRFCYPRRREKVMSGRDRKDLHFVR